MRGGKKSQSAMRIDIPSKSAVDSLEPPVRFVIAARNANFSYNVEEGAGHMSPGHTVSTPAGAVSVPGSMGAEARPRSSRSP